MIESTAGSPLAALLANERVWRVLLAALVVLGIGVALPGSTTVPLESHEIYVAQTAREMATRGDWLVPHFNGQPRLQKPPLSYWAAGAAAGAFGILPDVGPLQARLPSILAGAGLVLATALAGAAIYGRATAALAALLLATSAGFAGHTHDARPDMLYACWNAAGYCAFVLAARRRPGAWYYSLAMWLAYGAAVMTKGPQVPAMLVVASVIVLKREGRSWRELAAVLRPLLGAAVLAAICLPWWQAVAHGVGRHGVQTSQLGGSLLVPDAKHFGSPYYFYRPLQLLVPWVPLALLAVPCLVRREERAALRLLGVPVLVAAIAFSLGHQYRYFYMLPLLPLLCLLVARGVTCALDRGRRDAWSWARDGMLVVQAVVVVAAGVWAIRHAPRLTEAPSIDGFVLFGVVAVAYTVLHAERVLLSRTGSLVICALAAAAVWTVAAEKGILWDSERYDLHALATRAAAELGPDTPLAIQGITAAPFVYYTGRHVHTVKDPDDVQKLLVKSRERRLVLVVRGKALASFAARFGVTELMSRKRGGDEDKLVILRPVTDG
ncbi:MAG: glycosyltransferase family 39 protein [Gammaproteobacteria bacterium]|nr:glycosyltransferase family 39 protein [Gammaproteobacteria bacterium]